MCLIWILIGIAILFAAFFIALVGTFLALLPWLIVGLIAGALASWITRTEHGIFGDILVGLAGSVIGGVVFRIILHRQPDRFSLTGTLSATVGAIIFLALIKLINGRGSDQG